MRSHHTLAIVFGLLVSGPSYAAAPVETASACPGYIEHLVAAREQLDRGNREAAIVELKLADEALEACMPPEETVSLG